MQWQHGQRTARREETVSAVTPPSEEGQSLEQKIERGMELFRRGRRHWPVVIACFVVGAGGGVGAAMKAKKVYKSESMILYRENVDQRGVSSSDAEHPDVEGEMKKFLRSRTEILRIIDELKLYRDLRESLTPEAIFGEFIDKKFSMQVKSGDTFFFSFEHSDPVLTQRTVERMVSYLTESYNELRDKKLKGTLTYLDERVAKARKQTAEKEELRSKFAKEHPEIVTTGEGNITIGKVTVRGGSGGGGGKKHNFVAMTPEMRDLARQKATAVNQLNMMTGHRPEPAAAPAEGPNPDEEELRELKKELAQKKMEYTEQHPDVIRVKKRVEALQAKVNRSKRPAGVAAVNVVSNDPQVIELQGKIREIEEKLQRAQRASLGKLAGDKEKASSALPSATGVAPKAAPITNMFAEWSRLNLEAAMAAEELNDLDQRRQKEDLRIRGLMVGERFEIRDRAYLPQKPIKPNKKKIAGIGLALGLMMGLGYAAARVLLDTKIYDITDLRAASSLPVLAVIPRVSARAGQKA
jgi:succinoglycan biosynthesis transport protein ExoP